MQTVVLGPRPAEIDALIELRKRRGIDRYDEVWERSYHMAPAAHPAHGYIDRQLAIVLDPYAKRAALLGTGPFNLGEVENYRIPDGGYHRTLPTTVWVPTVAIVVEIVLPDDETYATFGFYFEHGVAELIIADPAEHSVTLWDRGPGEFVQTDTSKLLGVEAGAISRLIIWP